MDSRTRLVLVKMINKGLVGTIEGCVSTGKEANVYHAWPPAMPPVPTVHNPNPPELPKQIALKIFKTSILVFKDREKYITGEFRFKGGQSKNPRKMVRSTSSNTRLGSLFGRELLLSSLYRLLPLSPNSVGREGDAEPQAFGGCWDSLPSVSRGSRERPGDGVPRKPRRMVRLIFFIPPRLHRADHLHLLVLRPSMRLKDAEKHMDLPQKQEMYAECMIAIRKMYQVCKLVHADLSEYNILCVCRFHVFSRSSCMSLAS